MKTSNKILLAFAAFVVLLFTGLNVALSAKVKSGKYVSREEYTKDARKYIALQSFHAITLRQVKGIELIPSDSFGITITDIERRNAQFDYTIQNGTLVISAKRNREASSNWLPVRIHLPATSPIQITLEESWVRVPEDQRFATIAVVAGMESEFNVGGTIDSLTFLANDASMNLDRSATVGSFRAELRKKSHLNDDGANVLKPVNIQISDSSELRVSGKLLKQLSPIQ